MFKVEILCVKRGEQVWRELHPAFGCPYTFETREAAEVKIQQACPAAETRIAEVEPPIEVTEAGVQG